MFWTKGSVRGFGFWLKGSRFKGSEVEKTQTVQVKGMVSLSG
jgi:hypothetical protein